MMDAILVVTPHGCPERKSPIVRSGSNFSARAWPQPGGRGPDPMSIITGKHELLVVPFRGEWAP